ncbi:hypothetical protein LXL04_038992 [Taraxacum kok-saghyz]
MADEIGAGGDDCFVHPELLQRRKESVVVESKSDSGLTCSLPVSRKRARDYPTTTALFDFDLISDSSSVYILCTLRDIEERRKRNSRRLIAAVEEGLSKRLRAKEESVVIRRFSDLPRKLQHYCHRGHTLPLLQGVKQMIISYMKELMTSWKSLDSFSSLICRVTEARFCTSARADEGPTSGGLA